jgi:hypothetical protein
VIAIHTAFNILDELVTLGRWSFIELVGYLEQAEYSTSTNFSQWGIYSTPLVPVCPMEY